MSSSSITRHRVHPYTCCHEGSNASSHQWTCVLVLIVNTSQLQLQVSQNFFLFTAMIKHLWQQATFQKYKENRNFVLNMYTIFSNTMNLTILRDRYFEKSMLLCFYGYTIIKQDRNRCINSVLISVYFYLLCMEMFSLENYICSVSEKYKNVFHITNREKQMFSY